MRRWSSRRAPLVALLGSAVVLAGVAGTVPAAADHTAPPSTVTLVGSLQSELGCPGDWDPACAATQLAWDGESATWVRVATLPAGAYEWKIAVNGGWDENYGAGGVENGPNVPLVLGGPAEVRFTYDAATHALAVSPVATPPAEPTDEDRALAGTSLREDLTRERFYFVMADRFANGLTDNDTGGLTGGRLETGYDPTATGFYHGGDLQGIIEQLDYIEGLGTTAIWLTPSFQNRPVQGAPGQENAGYHGYWITDFTEIDPHLGTNADMAELVDSAHARGIKVFFDIITNHTADVIGYDPSLYVNGTLPYVSKADEPYVDVNGVPFDDRDYADGDPAFPDVDLDSFPYTPVVAPGDETVKTPGWLNDPTLYHNRGTSTFTGEDSEYGDFPSGSFSALDDLWTEHPTVVQGMIDIYETWVEQAGIDGFRIDTVKHVNMEFWQQFGPALQGYAAELGNEDFFMFGEVFDANPAFVSQYTTEGRLQAAVDFGFQAGATGFANGAATTGIRDFFASDDWYTDADSNVYSLPTFLGNHDMGRIGSFLRAADAGWTEDELLQRDQLAHSLMYLSRGQPVVYYGDEQGFSAPPDVPGGIGDQRAREDMFASQVDLYNSYDLIGDDDTTAEDNYDPDHPLYQHIAELSELRDAHPALADGAQVHRYASSSAGVYAFSRIDVEDRVEYVVATNNATEAKTVTFPTYAERMRFRGLWSSAGEVPAAVRADREGRLTVTVPAGEVLVWQARRPVPVVDVPEPVFKTPLVGGTVGGRAEIGVAVPGNPFVQATFAWRPVGTSEWQELGTDDNAPYRVFHDVGDLPHGTLVEYRAIVGQGPASDELEVTSTWAVVGDPPEVDPGGGGPVVQPASVSVPGSFNSEVGCPGDWQPECAVVDLTLDEEDLVWSTTFGDDEAPILTGGYAYKVAIDDSWDENYGVGAVRNGPDIPLPATGDPITFYYSHATHWVTNSLETPDLFTAAGSFQSELGCPADWAPDCLRSWLQDPDGDGTWTFRSEQLPPGAYEVKVTQDQTWDVNWGAGGTPGGANIGFSVGPAEGVLMSFDEVSHVLTVTTFPVTTTAGPDLTQQRANWLSRDVLAMDVPDFAPGWTYRLVWAAEGGLAVDAEAVLGGDSAPLTRLEGGLPEDLAAEFPHLASYEAFEVPRSVRRNVEELLHGQLALAVFDDLGRLVDATGIQLPGVLDDLYGGAARSDLGVTWSGGGATVAVWAPTAKEVALLAQPVGAPAEVRVPMTRNGNGVWSATGPASWEGARYAFEVRVYVPSTGAVETNVVTDPYALALTTDSQRSVMVDLSDDALEPRGWDRLRKPEKDQPEDTTVYELHVRDFSISDETVPAEHRGTYLAFADGDSDGMRHLRELADAGMTDVHLLPVFDIATIPERRADQAVPACDLEALSAADPAGEEQQACVEAVRANDGFNWGYDPWHYTTPEGSYATDPEGTTRTREFREMVAGLNRAGLRVVMDVVYNHTTASGQDPKSVLDRIVPGYYHRLSATGTVETSTCCANTATEHRMMEKLMVDSVVTWARDYKVDGFRFDLMGHHSKANMLAVREALDSLTVKRDGVDGKSIYVYGEGWNFGEVANDARFEQATQLNMAGTGIGTFSDRLRDAVRGGGPFDEDPRIQGFASGLLTDPNGSLANGTPEEQAQRMLLYHDQIKVGLAGNLRDYAFVDRTGTQVTGGQVDYNGQPAGYAADPSETVTYVDAHDNETLFDALQYKLPQPTTMADRVRMNVLGLSTTAFSQGVSFWHAGADILRSKSLDRNSYDSGDWFNRVDWSYQESTWGSGLPPATDNEAKWDYQRPLLADPALEPQPADIAAAHERALDLLEIRFSSPLFRLGDAALIQERVGFPIGGTDQTPGVIAMTLDDRAGQDLDRRWERIVVVWNATPQAQSVPLADTSGLRLHPVQASGADPVVKTTSVAGGAVQVPARTVAVLVQR